MQLDTEEMALRMRLEPITAKELADRVGISRQSVYNLLSGRSQPKPATLRRIAEELRCKPEILLTGFEAPVTEHENFAGVMVERYARDPEGYDVEAVALDYLGNYLVTRYGGLTMEQFEVAEGVARDMGGEFAKHLRRLFESCEGLAVPREIWGDAAGEAFNSFFEERLPSEIDGKMAVSRDGANE